MSLASPATRAGGRVLPLVVLRRAGTALRLLGWGALHWALGLGAQLLELLAPAALAAGAGWWALPHAVTLLPPDAPLRDVAAQTLSHLPTGVSVAGLWLTPTGLLADGLGLMALAALLHTVSVALTELAFRR